MESIFERMSRARGGTVKSAVVDHGSPAAWHGQKATTCVACKSDDDVLNGLVDSIESHQFLFGRFTALADARGCKLRLFALLLTRAHVSCRSGITAKATGDIPLDSVPAAPAINPSPAELRPVLSTLDHQLRQLYAALPARTALVLFTGHADPRRMSELNARKSAFEGALRMVKNVEELGPESRWTTADGRELEEEVEKAKRGLLFLGVKAG